MTHVDTRPAGIREWVGLGLLALPTILLGLDVTVLYLVMPSLAADLDPTATQTLWIMDAYGFFIAGFLITMGTLGDRIGRRRMLVIGVVAFAAVSCFAAFAPSADLLIVARVLLGVAGATLMPSTLSLISTMFLDTRQRAVAIGVWATMFSLGMAAGPVVGGALADVFWWGAAFLVALPIAVIVLAGAYVVLPEYADTQAGRLDLASVLLSLVTILPAVYAVKQVAAYGFDLTILASLLVALIAGVMFVRRQLRLESPLLDMALFTNRSFSAALAVMLVGLVGVGGSMYLVTQFLQMVEELSPAVAGLWMGPPALAMFLTAIGAPIVARRIRPGIVMAVTLGISVIGYLLLGTADTEGMIAVVVGYAFVYLGLGAIAALGTDIVVGAAPPTKSGSAAAMSETVQELGIAVGVALLGSLTTAVYRANAPTANLSEEAADRVGDSLTGAMTVSDQVPSETIHTAQAVFTSGMNLASLVAGVAVLAIAVLCLFTLRHIRPIGEGQPESVH